MVYVYEEDITPDIIVDLMINKYNEHPFPIEFKSIYQAILENVFKGDSALFKMVQIKAREYLKRRVMP